MVDLPAMVASAIESERSSFTAAVLLSNNSRTVKKLREILPKKLRMVRVLPASSIPELIGK